MTPEQIKEKIMAFTPVEGEQGEAMLGRYELDVDKLSSFLADLVNRIKIVESKAHHVPSSLPYPY